MPWISYLFRDKIRNEWDEIGEGHWDNVTFNDSFICCVWTLCPGSNRTSSGTFALGQQNPVTMSIRKFLFVLGLQFLCLLCVAVILVIRKKRGKHIVPRGKGCHLFWGGGSGTYDLKISVICNSTQPLLVLPDMFATSSAISST